MKSDKKILVAFLLNFLFSIFEFFGGLFTGSVAILSDALHDLGDAASIGIAYFLERKSRQKPDSTYTYGYARFSVLGGLMTTVILLVGSVFVIVHATQRLFHPVEIRYNEMILFAIVGAAVNLFAAIFTRDGESLNQKAINLHMLEDVLGWIVVLIGAVVMRFTGWALIDPVLSIAVAVFILWNAARNLLAVGEMFLEKIPRGICLEELKEHLLSIDGVVGVHHIHIWNMDETSIYATMHIVTDEDPHQIKEMVREELSEHGICHATLETERSDETCHDTDCHSGREPGWHGHHHHHHHHHSHGHPGHHHHHHHH